MCALVPPFFPNFGWPSTGEYESYYLAGENLDNCTFFYFPVPETYRVVHQRNSLGVTISSAGTGIDNSPVVNKKLKHNASERDRRKKINSLFSSLCSCLPASDQSVSSYFDKIYVSLYYLEEKYKTNYFSLLSCRRS